MDMSDPNASQPPPYSATDKAVEAYPHYPPASGAYPNPGPYPPGQYPRPEAGAYPPPVAGGYPPYPTPSGYPQYPAPSSGMPQPVTSQPGGPHTGATTEQPKPVTTTTVVIQTRGDCTKCYVGNVVETFTLAGICCAIWFFPCGILCCLTWRRRICSNCGAIYI